MQAILIMLPILVYAFLTGVLLAWVLFVVLPRLHRAGKKRAPRTTRRDATTASRPPGTPVVDADQQAGRRSV